MDQTEEEKQKTIDRLYERIDSLVNDAGIIKDELLDIREQMKFIVSDEWLK